MSGNGLELAVIGMAGRFPGAPTIEHFWRNLCEGVESIARFSDEELIAAGVPREALRSSSYVKASGALDAIDLFDAGFFGYTPREAEILDPQQRLFLEVAWEALERAGCDPEVYRGAIGIYAGMSRSAYLFNLMANPEAAGTVGAFQTLLATDKDFLATRVAYKLNLQGPAVVVQTACSSSLAAAHLACQALLAGECDVALAGGASIRLPPRVGYVYERDGIASPDGHCRSFDAEAAGTVSGSGVGIVVLKRLADALKDGDHISAVIKGSAMNNDGSGKVGYTAPSVEGQAQVIRLAQAVAGVEPETIGCVEAHGTGTPLGDPIEIAALNQAFGAAAGPATCAIGSVKSNIGHLDAAAGVTGLIKAALQLEHATLVPTLHFKRPNPRFDLAAGPFYVNVQRQPWCGDGGPRRAAVSSFGIGGTNVHAVLEEAPKLEVPKSTGRPQVIVVSARSEAALERARVDLAARLREQPDMRIEDVAHTLQVGRRAFAHRSAVVGRDTAEAAAQLAAEGGAASSVVESGEPPLAFLFTGQGAQYAGMGAGLYATEPRFRREVDECCEVLRPDLGFDLRRVLGLNGELAAGGPQIHETSVTQPALFVIDYALARLLMEWGVKPGAMLGHSVGEFVAACLAGVFSRDEALSLVAARGRLMQGMEPGAMLAIALSPAAVEPYLDGLEVAVVNAPDACVLSGAAGRVTAVEERLRAEGVAVTRLATSHAFHSRMMEPIVSAFAERVAAVRRHAPRIPFVSNVTGTWIRAAEATDPAYWARHLRQPVRFADGIAALLDEPRRVLLEVGPGHTLAALARRRFPAGARYVALSSLRQAKDATTDDAFLQTTLARLWLSGIRVDWSARRGSEPVRKVVLPTYPFERSRYWIDPRPSAALPAPGRKEDVSQWLYVPSWKRSAPLAAPSRDAVSKALWCLFADEQGLADQVLAQLRTDGARAVVVTPGASFEALGDDRYRVRVAEADDYARLRREMAAGHAGPTRYLHLWSVGPASPDELERGFFSVLALCAALGASPRAGDRLTVVTSDAREVRGDERLVADRTLAAPVCTVLSQEHPTLGAQSIDIEWPHGADGVIACAEAIVREVSEPRGAPVVAHRGRHRWIRQFERVTAAEPEADAASSALRPRGVCWITGGLGGVGLALARFLARETQARLVFTARSPLPPAQEWNAWLEAHAETDPVSRRIRALRELEAMGAETLVLAADVADRAAMKSVLDQIDARFGGLHGVIHAAGATDRRLMPLLARSDRAASAAQLVPKRQGTLVLAELLEDRPLDFVLMTSSLSADLGGLGLGSYAAANAFLDAFAHCQHREGRSHWMSVGWDAWQFPTDAADDGGASGLAITAEDGAELFARALRLRATPHVLVSTVDLGARADRWTQPAAASTKTARPPSAHARPALLNPYVPPEKAAEKTLAQIWSALLGIDRVGIRDNFFELGGSSLTAIQLVARVESELGAPISVATLFGAPTIEALAAEIRDSAGTPTHVAAGAHPHAASREIVGEGRP